MLGSTPTMWTWTVWNKLFLGSTSVLHNSCLCRAFESGVCESNFSPDELHAAADSFIIAVQKRLRSGAAIGEPFHCRRDILMCWFGDKPKNRGAWTLDRKDFPGKYFLPGWDRVLDQFGQGPQVVYPITLRPTVRRSPKNHTRGEAGHIVAVQQVAVQYGSVNFAQQQCKEFATWMVRSEKET